MKLMTENGVEFEIDYRDYHIVKNMKWYAVRGRGHGPQGKINTHYIMSPNPITYIHRLILMPDKGILVDHIDKDGKNNKRENLRLATSSQNGMNKKSQPGESGFRGVFRCRDKWTYCVQFSVNGKTCRIRKGGFKTPEMAAKERDMAAIKFHGSFAVLNFSIMDVA